jgi:hypothetical protein
MFGHFPQEELKPLKISEVSILDSSSMNSRSSFLTEWRRAWGIIPCPAKIDHVTIAHGVKLSHKSILYGKFICIPGSEENAAGCVQLFP